MLKKKKSYNPFPDLKKKRYEKKCKKVINSFFFWLRGITIDSKAKQKKTQTSPSVSYK